MKTMLAITGPLKGLGYIITLPIFAVVAILLLGVRKLVLMLKM